MMAELKEKEEALEVVETKVKSEIKYMYNSRRFSYE